MIEQSKFKEVIMKDEKRKSENPKMKDDIIITQIFTCCGHENERFFWEGWDCVEDDTIDIDVVNEFKFCPYCGKKLTNRRIKNGTNNSI